MQMKAMQLKAEIISGTSTILKPELIYLVKSVLEDEERDLKTEKIFEKIEEREESPSNLGKSDGGNLLI